NLVFKAHLGDNGFQYRAVFANRYGVVYTAAASLTVSSGSAVAPVVITQPAPPAGAVNSGQRVTFTAAAENAAEVQWQASADGVSFSNIAGANSGTYSFRAQ